jgi:hypothetical protein
LPHRAAPSYESTVRIGSFSVVLGPFLVAACGGSSTPAGAAPPSSVPAASRHREATPAIGPTPVAGGSSDGMTCEQAREQYTEEINMQAGGPADLKAEDFAAVLNNGSYLNPCDVPSSSKVRVCAAVQNGHAVGVTVFVDPPSAEQEVCVAGQVRQLTFPPHTKMDIVTVNF